MRDPDRAGGDDEWLRYCARVPLTEIATEGSLGVVVHSWWHSRRIDGSLLGDVTVAPLPVPSAELGFTYDESNTTSAMLDDLDDNALLVVTVGAVNANRRVDLLLEAMADDPVLANRMHLWAVGAAGNGAANGLLQLAGSLGLRDRFVITGRVSDGMLGEILARADIAAALRDPVLEGQSASVLTQLLAGIPVVVFDHAHYSELPDEVAEKVDPDDALAGVGRALRILVDDEAGRIRRGDLAREFVLRTRSGAAYAAALLEAGEQALATKPLMHLTSDIGTLLKRLDLHQDDAVVDKVSDMAFELYDLG
jgi:glycosyltransferase involved in cell wall biosynthesis